MVKEFEKAGIPIVHLTTLVGVAKGVGSNRIVGGYAITNPLGDPQRTFSAELNEVRIPLTEKCLKALMTEVSGPTIIE